MKWVCVGQAMGSGRGKPKPKKTELDGKMYDHVTKVFITEQHSVMLGWNEDDDPQDVVDSFAALYSLTEDLKYQVFEFVKPKTNPNAIAARKEREKREKLAAAMRHVPNWEKFGFQLFADTSKLGPMRKRLQKTLDAKADATATEKKGFALMMSNLENTSQYHSSKFTADERSFIVSALQWKGKDLLPVLDALRVLMQHADAVKTLSEDSKVRELLLAHLNDPAATKHQLMLSLRVLANLVARRPRADKERKHGEAPQDVVQFITSAVAGSTRCVDTKADLPVRTAATVFLSNVICWIGMNKVKADALTKSIVDICIPALLAGGGKSNMIYYLLVATASAARLKPEIKAYIAPKVTGVPAAVKGALTQSVVEALADFRKVFGV
uniref:PUL domain-containing protein n=1 Tax=Lotharella oceanica TaxID=641309 RepID=A0A7S2XH73_9EUKA